MAIVFNATTTLVTSALTTHNATRTYSLWTYRIGDGESGLGRLFDKRVGSGQVEVVLSQTVPDEYQYQRQFTVTNGTWGVARPSADAWHNLIITYDSSNVANDPIFYIDGAATALGSDSNPTALETPTDTADAFVVGNRGNAERTWDGYLCEFAVWNRILTAAEAASIGTDKFSPLFYPDSLVEYLPMVREAVSFKLAAPTFTSTTIVPHPDIIYPSISQIRRFTTAVVAAATVKQLASLGVG